MTAASEAGIDEETAVVAPHFECSNDSPASGDVYWACAQDDWSHGFADTSGAASPIYSYAVMDQLISDFANKATFPNLATIVVIGMGSGGQFAQRYAATNSLDPMSGVAIHYVVLAPSSFAYLDANRPASTANCSGFNDYHYGLDNRTGYVAHASAAAIQQQYLARNVSYFVGSEDTLANAQGTDLDTSCAANAQGVDRVARATNFSAAIQAAYHATPTLTLVPGCMHSRACMLYSPQVRTAIFGDYTAEVPNGTGGTASRH